MNTEEKFQALHLCVESEGDGGIAWFGAKERNELTDFLDEIEERWGIFEEGK